MAAGLVVVSTIGPALLARFGILGEGFMAVSFFGTLAAGAVLMPGAARPILHGSKQSLLTAGRVAGLRTVDLDALVRIRRLELASRGPWIDQLVLTDANRIVLAVDDPAVDAAVRAALQRRPAGSRAVRISRHAQERLGPDRPTRGRRALRAVNAMLVPFVVLPVPIFAILAVGLSIAGYR